MKRILYVLASLALMLTSCHKDIWQQLDDHENRISRLEELCGQMNTNISSLQTIVSALEQKDYVTSVAPVKVDGVTIGYTISFSKSGDITIYHGHDGVDGTDGNDGYVPVIGVKADEDGTYYWTLDGEWMLDDDGNRIKASSTDGTDGSDGADGTDGADGKDGEDGITPRLKIDNGLWYVSYDNGTTWILAGKATGEDGQDGTNVFTDVVVTDDSVTLTLSDGQTVISLPRQQTVFDISFKDGSAIRCGAGETVSLEYALSYGSEDAVIKIFPDSDLDISLEQTDEKSGVIKITAPDPFMEDVEVTLLVSDGADRTLMRTVSLSLEYDESYIIRYESNTGERLDLDLPAMLSNTYADGVGEIVFGTRVRTVTGFNGHIDLKGITIPSTATAIGNAAFKDCTGLYKVDIPDGINMIEDYAFAGCDRLVEVNFGTGVTRLGSNVFEGCTGFTEFEVPDRVTSLGGYVFKDCNPDLKVTISYDLLMKSALNKTGHIILKGNPESIANNAFQNCTGLLSIELPASVVSLGSYAFAGCTALSKITLGDNIRSIGVAAFSSVPVTSFVMPSLVTELSARTFEGCRKLEEIDLGDKITAIGDSAFESCLNLESVRIPDTVESIGSRAFIGTWLDEVTFGSGLKSIGAYAFAGLFFKNVDLPDGLEEMGEAAFGSCAHLESIDLGANLKSLPEKALQYCGSLTTLSLPATVSAIGADALSDCNTLSALYCLGSVPPVLSAALPAQTSVYVPQASLESYKAADSWSAYADRIFAAE